MSNGAVESNGDKTGAEKLALLHETAVARADATREPTRKNESGRGAVGIALSKIRMQALG